MGRISESQKEPTTNHFSHPHPLNLCNYHPQQTFNPSSSCSGCKLKPSGLIYTCTTCNYFLHKKCFEMPKKITHPCHKDHAFTLLPEPAYADGLFNCDACGEKGDGFSYHCKPCGLDLHILCAVMPLSLSHPTHVHKLDLTFESPHLSKMFSCDVCKNSGVMNHWVYRCNACDFDAHLNCARGVYPVQSQGQQNNFMGFQSQGQLPPQAATFSRSAPAPPPPLGFGPFSRSAPPPPPPLGFGPHYVAPRPPPLQQSFVPPSPTMIHNPAIGVPAGSPIRTNPYEASRQSNELFLQAIQQRVNDNNALTQAILAGSAGGFGSGGAAGFVNGGGGYGGDNRTQQLMQLLSSINSNGGNIGGGGGGVGFPGMNALGGGAGGQDSLQAMMNNIGGGGGGGGGVGFPGINAFGGGAGGQDFLQALMNNGGSGGGGMDILQSILGGGSGLDFLGGALGGFNF